MRFFSIKSKFKSQEGSVLPFFAMTSVIMLLVVFLIVDIGKAHIVQSDGYKSVDAAALAGATQADNFEKVKYVQQAHKEPVYKTVNVYNETCSYNKNDKWTCTKKKTGTREVFDHWKTVIEDPVRTVLDKWAVIRGKDAQELANEVFWKNANHSTITEKGRSVENVEAFVTEPDQFEVDTDVKTENWYFPSFSEGFFNKETPNKVTIHKEAESKAKPITW